MYLLLCRQRGSVQPPVRRLCRKKRKMVKNKARTLSCLVSLGSRVNREPVCRSFHAFFL